jgi:hypothetical protein
MFTLTLENCLLLLMLSGELLHFFSQEGTALLRALLGSMFVDPFSEHEGFLKEFSLVSTSLAEGIRLRLELLF